MAHYLDSFETFSSLDSMSAYDDPSSYLADHDFDLDAAIFSDPGPIPSRTLGPASTSSYTHFPEYRPLNNAAINPLGTSTSSNSHATYDPDSPFNSPMSTAASMSVRGLTRDGRFRTKLIGVGSDGGYLTSPLIVGKTRTDSRTGRPGVPAIAIDSPAATPRTGIGRPVGARTVSSRMAGNLSLGSPTSSTGLDSTLVATSASGSRADDLQVDDSEEVDEADETITADDRPLGMGISGVGDLAAQLEMGDYGNPNLKIFAMPKPGANLQSGDGECGFLPYPDHMPTTTLGRGKNNVIDVESGAVDGANEQLPSRSPTKFVEHSFLNSPPPSHANRSTTSQPRPKKAFPNRTINKAKSCSALSASAKRQARADDPLFEPMTPSSHHTANFLHPHVPFNSPQEGLAINLEPPNSMPFSFSDLYNLGLAHEAPEEFESVKKSPSQFAHNLLMADGAGLGLGMVQDPYDGSCFSSPSTPYLSDPSPDLAIPVFGGDGLSSAEMFPANSIDSFLSLDGSAPTSVNLQYSQGRQRCATYGAPESRFIESGLLSPQVNPHRTRNRQPSAQAAYGGGATKNFSYPSRFAAQAPNLPISPPLHSQAQFVQDALPVPPVPTTPTHARTSDLHQRSVTGPPALPNLENVDLSFLYQQPVTSDLQAAYNRNLETFDSLYETYGAGRGGDAHGAGKRARSGDDEHDDDPDYILSPATQHSHDGTETRAKRLRSVASAPCLHPRRMRPGPRPKGLKSPQAQQESVFSATLSPPIPQVRRATSPYASPLPSGVMSDDDCEPGGATTITYTPGPRALPGMPRSSVPKNVLESLYSHLPAHVDKNGEKVGKRYVCLIEGCERTFPRKSAIESHIQTHLEDKPFVCSYEDCDASFVRHHDLRRHERIHSGNKPFPCPCGKGFARGDALARHRARGICSGSLVPRRI
ncbi:C2H2-type zinc finger protein [Sporobolomyces koalae]|uniref:C2H2-type zinc finger protein n=1 Tax=Sporobolomyces koalae TaxID=500713 RepID=UPI003176CA08